MIDLTSKTDDELRSLIAAAIEELGARQFKAGGAAMRERILMAAGDDQTPRAPAPRQLTDTHEPTSAPKERAPRGSVGVALEAILSESPGATIVHIEKEVARRFPDISVKSAGNELRRMEGKKYKRDRENGYHWFLIDSKVDRENGGLQLAPGFPRNSSDDDSDGGEHAAP